MSDNNITMLRVDALHESPFNPRKIFDDTALQELATDIKAHGRVLQPLLVRPRIPPLFVGDPAATAGHEIVFGHRRYRAAELAGLAEVPCMVRALDDDEARRAQISENLQRKDVHPIEEAEGFQALIDNDNQTADTIAAQFGKSRSYVYGRLKLLEACPEIRKACLAGEIGSEVALLVARLRTAKLQEKALEYIKNNFSQTFTDGGKRSFRRIRDMLNEKFTLDLKGVMFDVEDEMLLPLAGNCVTCPKRSSNAPEFEDVLNEVKRSSYSPQHFGPNVCTDPDCFDLKKKAHLKREADKLVTQGKVVVSGNAARAAISASGEIKGAYVAAAKLKELPKFSASGYEYAKDIVLIQDPRTGKTHKAVKAEDLKAAGLKMPAPKPVGCRTQRSSREYEAEQRANEAKAAIETKVHRAVYSKVLAELSLSPRTKFDLQLLAIYMLDQLDYDTEEVLLEAYGAKHTDQIKKKVPDMSADALASLMLAVALSKRVDVSAWNLEEEATYLMTAAKQYEIDVDATRAEATGVAPTPSTAARDHRSEGCAGGSGGQADLLEEAGA